MNTANLKRATMVVAGGMLLGRFTGLIRELVLAAQFGMTRDADIAMLAISVPDLLNTLFIGGALTAVLIPEIHRLRQHVSPHSANQVVCQFMSVVLFGSLVLTALVLMGDKWFVQMLAPGLDPASHAVATRLIDCVLLAIPLCTATAVTSAALQANLRVGIPAFGTLIFNIALIVGICLAGRATSLSVIGWAVVIGAGLRVATQFIDAWRDGWFRKGWEAVWRLGLLNRSHGVRYGEALIAVGVAVCLPVIGRAFASHVDGGIACFSYSWKLVELPSGLIGALISMVVFPRISQSMQDEDSVSGHRLIHRVARLCLLASVPMVIVFVGAAYPLTRVLFQHGRVTVEQVSVVAMLSRITFLALPASILSTLAIGVFHARRDTRAPFVVGLLTIAALGVSAYFSTERWGLVGLVSAVVAVQWIQLASQIIVLRRRHHISLFGEIFQPKTKAAFGDAPPPTSESVPARRAA